MADPAYFFKNLVWALTVLLQIALLIFALRHKIYRHQPAFLVYVITAALENAAVFVVYRVWDFSSLRAWTLAWSAQAVVIATRWLAVAEIARKIFVNYRGIRALANRILFVLGVVVLFYAVVSSRHDWRNLLLPADRGVELCIAVFIVGLFVFARYYRLPASPLQKQLAVGFCIYSCTAFLNDAIFERWPNIFGGLWNYLPALSYFACLLLWMKAVRKPAEAAQPATTGQISPEVYAQLLQQLNSRLNMLNDRLNYLFHSEDTRP